LSTVKPCIEVITSKLDYLSQQVTLFNVKCRALFCGSSLYCLRGERESSRVFEKEVEGSCHARAGRACR
jgi:hypothetical protein